MGSSIRKAWPSVVQCVAFFAALACLFAASLAIAQSYPNTTVRIVVPFTPGQGVDVIARSIGQQLSDRWGRPVIIVNKPGASGAIGTTLVAGAPADGHTLLMTSNGLLTAPLLRENAPYDPIRDFQPIALVGWTSMVLVSSMTSDLKSVAHLVEAARRRPGKITYGSTGVGLPHHLAMELFKNRIGLNLLHVPYKGTTGAVSDLMSGQIDVMFLPSPVAFPQTKAGKIRALAVASEHRHVMAPEIPTLRELGYSGSDADLWYGLLAPRGVPKDIAIKLEADVLQALARTDVKAVMQSLGIGEPVTYSSGKFEAFLSSEHARWANVVKQAGIKAE